MLVNRGYKFKILPTDEQIKQFIQYFGCSRKVYNLYVNELYNYLDSTNYTDGKIEGFKVCSPKRFKQNYSYLKYCDSLALCNAEINFKKALRNYNKESYKKVYTKKSKRRLENQGITPTYKDLKGIPRFKSRKNGDFSYTTNNQSHNGKWNDIVLEDKMLKLPKFKTLIKVKQHRPLPNNSIIKNATISMDARGVFYVSLCVEYEVAEPKKIPSIKTLGLDYSQKDFYVDNEGKKANYPHYYKKSQEKLAKLQRQLSKKEFDSNNYKKLKKKIAVLHGKIANQRLDWIHKETTRLANEYDAIFVEDINLRNLGECLSLGKNLHDNGFGMFRTILAYKLEERGKQFIKIDKTFASTKTCNCCGNKKDIKLQDRWYICELCGYEADRDINAAKNIKDFGTRLLAW